MPTKDFQDHMLSGSWKMLDLRDWLRWLNHSKIKLAMLNASSPIWVHNWKNPYFSLVELQEQLLSQEEAETLDGIPFSNHKDTIKLMPNWTRKSKIKYHTDSEPSMKWENISIHNTSNNLKRNNEEGRWFLKIYFLNYSSKI